MFAGTVNTFFAFLSFAVLLYLLRDEIIFQLESFLFKDFAISLSFD